MKDLHPILIVDDDPDDRDLVIEAFHETECKKEYVPLENGVQLLEFLEKADEAAYPSMILLDLNMPYMSGQDVLQQLKNSKELRHIPVVVYTTSSLYKDRETSYKLGANCFLTKPDSFDGVVKIINSISELWCLNEKAS